MPFLTSFLTLALSGLLIWVIYIIRPHGGVHAKEEVDNSPLIRQITQDRKHKVIPGVQFGEAQTFAVQPAEMLYCFWRLLDANISPESTERKGSAERLFPTACSYHGKAMLCVPNWKHISVHALCDITHSGRRAWCRVQNAKKKNKKITKDIQQAW